MSKPPFIISNRTGRELWQNTIQLPTITTVEYEGIGDTAEEKAEALKAARRHYDENFGLVKQYYLRMRSSSDLGVAKYAHHSTKLAPGLVATYDRNYDRERLHIKSSVQVKIDVYDPKNPQNQPLTVDIMWLIDTTGSTGGGENAPITLAMAQQYSEVLRNTYPEISLRCGAASVGDYAIDPFGNEGDKPYALNQPLSSKFTGWSLTAFGGGDTPEAQLDAALECLNDPAVKWLARLKIMVLSTDATFHQGSPHTTVGALDAALTANRFRLLMVGPALADEFQNPPQWINIADSGAAMDELTKMIDEILLPTNQYGITG